MFPGVLPRTLLGLAAHGQDPAAAPRILLHGDDRGLARDDSLALDVDEGVRGSEVNREIVREQAVKPVEDHGALLAAKVKGGGSPSAEVPVGVSGNHAYRGRPAGFPGEAGSLRLYHTQQPSLRRYTETLGK